ncbi:MAG: FAD/NAD(P)-binding oxidoreductase [Thermoplasmatales archaeon]
MVAKNIVIVGGNAGGGLLAGRLSKMLPKDQANITVLDKLGKVEFQPSFTYLALGNRSEEQVSKNFIHMERENVKPIKAEVTKVDAGNRIVYTNDSQYRYDILILSPGVQLNDSRFPGYQDTYHFWDVKSALRLRSALAGFKKGKIVISVASPIYKCPPVPWEMSMMLHEYFTNKGLRNNVEITVAHPMGRQFEMFGSNIATPLGKWMNEMKIKGIYKFLPAYADPSKHELVGQNNEKISYDLAIVSPIQTAPDFIFNNDDLKSKVGWADSNYKNFKNSKYDDIYSIGDVISPTLGMGMAGAFTHFEADTVATFVANDVIGSYLTLPFNPVAMCAMEGGSYGWVAYCDFSKKLKDPSYVFNDCSLMDRGRIYKMLHSIYEKYYYATILRGRV